MNTSPAAETPGPIAVIEGPVAHLSVSASETRTAAITLALGYSGPSTMHLTDEKTIALIEALRVQLRQADCSPQCIALCDAHGESRPDRGWHLDDCPAILERLTVADLQGVIVELVRERVEAARTIHELKLQLGVAGCPR